MDLKHTPLYNKHVEYGAKMGPFGGWDMPIQYEGIIAEHNQCRTSASLFDTSHMGIFYITGDIEKSGFEYPFSYFPHDIKQGRCKYGLLMNKNGGIIDDLIVYRLADNRLMAVVNAATTQKDYDAITKESSPEIDIEDASEDISKLDLQGPEARNVARDVIHPDIEKLKFFRFMPCTIFGEDALISRTGYTGELGYEIYLPKGKCGKLWDTLLSDQRVKPAGLGARDMLRLEVGLSLYGSDIDDTTTPVEADIEFCVNYQKDFPGKEVLLEQKAQGTNRVRAALKTNTRKSARKDDIIKKGDNEIGYITSGIYSPSVGSSVALGFVKPEYAKKGSVLSIQSGKKPLEAEVVDLPFYKEGTLRS